MAQASKLIMAPVPSGSYTLAQCSIILNKKGEGWWSYSGLTLIGQEEGSWVYFNTVKFSEDGSSYNLDISYSTDFSMVGVYIDGQSVYEGPATNTQPTIAEGYGTLIVQMYPLSQATGVDTEAVNALIDARFNNNNGTLPSNDDHLKFDDKVTSPVTSATLDDCGYYNVTYAPLTGVGSTT